MSEINFAKIRKIFPEIEKSDSVDDLRRLAEKLDKAESLEVVMTGDMAMPILDSFRTEIGLALANLFDNVDDHKKLIPIIERLRFLTGVYKKYTHAKDDADILRNMVDELVQEEVA